MKHIVFLALLLSSFMAVACDDNELNGLGGSVTDGKQLPQTNSGLSNFSDNSDIGQIECDIADQTNIYVTGTSYFSIPRLTIGISYFLSGAGGGGGGNFGKLEQGDGCHNIQGEYRMDVGTAAFVLARSSVIGLRDRLKFAAKYAAGSVFEFEFPDGSVAKFEVGAWNSAVPLVSEAAGSCS